MKIRVTRTISVTNEALWPESYISDDGAMSLEEAIAYEKSLTGEDFLEAFMVGIDIGGNITDEITNIEVMDE